MNLKIKTTSLEALYDTFDSEHNYEQALKECSGGCSSCFMNFGEGKACVHIMADGINEGMASTSEERANLLRWLIDNPTEWEEI